MSILTDLHRQRQTIEHSRDTLHGADDNIARARKVPPSRCPAACGLGARCLCVSVTLCHRWW